MDFNEIDWNSMWQAELAGSNWKQGSSKELWNKRAESFSKSISQAVEEEDKLDKDDYISKMLARVQVKPEWSVLDIGCGPGTLAIPLAKKAASLTALDLSSEMLKYLKINAEKSGLSNIRYLNASWQEALASGLPGKHDVVVASRCLMSGDMKEFISWVRSIAAHAVYVTFPIIHLPFDWEVYKAIGRNGKRQPPFIYFYNLLYQMGIHANVEILLSRVRVRFSSIEEAISQLQWRTDPFTAEEKARLVDFLEKKFKEQKETGALTHEGYSKWALIWWKPEEQ